MEEKRFLRLQKSADRLPNGLYKLKLGLYRRGGDWALLDEVWCVSGLPECQNFRTGSAAEPGSYEPIPEGYYWCGIPEWRSTVGDWNASWGNGLGPVWIGLTKFTAQQTRRDSFGIHQDSNISIAPGSAGCVVFQDNNEHQKLLSWFDDPRIRPEFLTVNWGLKTVDSGGSSGSISQLPLPQQPSSPAPQGGDPAPLPAKPQTPQAPVAEGTPSSKPKLWIVAAALLVAAAAVGYLAFK